MPVFGFRVRDFAYLTDVNFIPEAEMAKLQHLEVLVLGALQRDPHLAHYNLEQALEVTEKIRPKRAYFTHISHRLGLQREVDALLPAHVKLAYDGLQLVL